MSLASRYVSTALAALVSAVVLTAYTPTSASAQSGGDFVKVATHPQAVAQPASGVAIKTLKAWNGKLYAGYGNWNYNTGPIAITPFDGTKFVDAPALWSDTEAIERYREINGRLYVPSIDPRSSSDYASGTLLEGVTSWANPTAVHSSHAFDMASLTGSDLWLVGSQGDSAVAWRSLDGGATWQPSLTVPGPAKQSNRFYGVGVYRGKLYVQLADMNGLSRSNRSKVFDGSTWSDGPDLGAFANADVFAGKMVFRTGYFYGSLEAFDGTNRSTVYGPTRDYAIDGTTLYVLGTDGSIKATDDLVNWKPVGQAPAEAMSIALLDGSVYVGGSDGAIYRHAPGTVTVDTTAPTVRVVNPVDGTTIGSRTNISVEGSDDRGVVNLELYVDNRLISSFPTEAVIYNYTWRSQKVAAGSHTITAKAYDAAGNVGQASVTVTK